MTENASSEELVANLVRLLTVKRRGEDHFVANPLSGGKGRVFGGQVIAQALQAAQLSVPSGMQAHSLHAYFLRPGEEGPPIDLAVGADFDGRSFANRRVVASQDKPILNLTASFQHPEEGLQHEEYSFPSVEPPEELRSDQDLRLEFVEAHREKLSQAQLSLMTRPRPIEIRTSGKLHWMNAEPRPPEVHSWFRTVADLPAIEDDPAIHRAVIAYASDFTLLGTAALPHGLSWARGEIKGASLDHAIWFHRHARADDWLLYSTISPWSGSGRGFNLGRIFDRDGRLIASVAQEGVIRLTD